MANGVGRLTLNRPEALHALNTGCAELMTEALLAWRDDPAVQAVLIDHAGERGFCAGGDIRMLAESGAGDGAAAAAVLPHRVPAQPPAVRLPQAGGRGDGRDHHGRRRRHLHCPPLPHRHRADDLRHARDRHRPLPRRRRRLVPAAAARPVGDLAGADRRAAQGGRLPGAGHRHRCRPRANGSRRSRRAILADAGGGVRRAGPCSRPSPARRAMAAHRDRHRPPVRRRHAWRRSSRRWRPTASRGPQPSSRS